MNESAQGLNFEYVGKTRVIPFILCYGCSLPIYEENSHCFIGGDSPTYRFYCSTCMKLFFGENDPGQEKDSKK
jgi:hypothetical protein